MSDSVLERIRSRLEAEADRPPALPETAQPRWLAYRQALHLQESANLQLLLDESSRFARLRIVEIANVEQEELRQDAITQIDESRRRASEGQREARLRLMELHTSHPGAQAAIAAVTDRVRRVAMVLASIDRISSYQVLAWEADGFVRKRRETATLPDQVRLELLLVEQQISGIAIESQGTPVLRADFERKIERHKLAEPVPPPAPTLPSPTPRPRAYNVPAIPPRPLLPTLPVVDSLNDFRWYGEERTAILAELSCLAGPVTDAVLAQWMERLTDCSSFYSINARPKAESRIIDIANKLREDVTDWNAWYLQHAADAAAAEELTREWNEAMRDFHRKEHAISAIQSGFASHVSAFEESYRNWSDAGSKIAKPSLDETGEGRWVELQAQANLLRSKLAEARREAERARLQSEEIERILGRGIADYV